MVDSSDVRTATLPISGGQQLYGPSECAALLEEAQCMSEAEADAVLRRVACNMPTPHPAITAAVLDLAVVHPRVTVPYVPDLISASSTDVAAALDTFSDLLQADRRHLVPVIGTLSELPLSLQHRAQARATLAFALRTVDDGDIPTVVRAVLRAASTPALARWAAPALRNALARPLPADVILVIGIVLRECCRSRPHILRALLSSFGRPRSRSPIATPPSQHVVPMSRLTWLDLVVSAIALDYRACAARPSPAGASLSGSSVSDHQTAQARLYSSLRSLARGAIANIITQQIKCNFFSTHAEHAVRTAAPVLESIPDGSRRLFGAIVSAIPPGANPLSAIRILACFANTLPGLARLVIGDLARVAATVGPASAGSIVPSLVLEALVPCVPPSVFQSVAGVRLPARIAVQLALATSNRGMSLSVSNVEEEKGSQRKDLRRFDIIPGKHEHENDPDYDCSGWTELLIAVRKGMLFGADDERLYALSLAASIVDRAPRRVVSEIVRALDHVISTDLSDWTAMAFFKIIATAALRPDAPLSGSFKKSLFERRVEGPLGTGTVSVEAMRSEPPVGTYLRSQIPSLDPGHDVRPRIQINIYPVRQQFPAAASNVLTGAIALLANQAELSNDLVANKASLYLDVNVLVPEACALIYEALEVSEEGANAAIVNRGNGGLKSRTTEGTHAAPGEQDEETSSPASDFVSAASLLSAISLADLIAALESLSVAITASMVFMNSAVTDGHRASKFRDDRVSESSENAQSRHQRQGLKADFLDSVFERVSEIYRMIRALHFGVNLLRTSDRVVQRGANIQLTSSPSGRTNVGTERRKIQDQVSRLIALDSLLQTQNYGQTVDRSDSATWYEAGAAERTKGSERIPSLSPKAVVAALLAMRGETDRRSILTLSLGIRKRDEALRNEVTAEFDAAVADGEDEDELGMQERRGELVGIELMLLTQLSAYLLREDLRLRGRHHRDPGLEKGLSSAQGPHTNLEDQLHFSDLPAPGGDFYGPESESEVAENCASSESMLKNVSVSSSSQNAVSDRSQFCQWSDFDECAAFGGSLPEFLDISEVNSTSFDFPVLVALLIDRAILNSGYAAQLRRSMPSKGQGNSYLREAVIASGISLQCLARILQGIVDRVDPSRGYPARGDGSRGGPVDAWFFSRVEDELRYEPQTFDRSNVRELQKEAVLTTIPAHRVIASIRWIANVAIDVTQAVLALNVILVLAEAGCVSVADAHGLILADLKRIHEYQGDKLWKCIRTDLISRNPNSMLPELVSSWVARRRECGIPPCASMADAGPSIRISLGGHAGCPWFSERYRLLSFFTGLPADVAVEECLCWTGACSDWLDRSVEVTSCPKKGRKATRGIPRPKNGSRLLGSNSRNPLSAFMHIFGADAILEVLIEVCLASLFTISIPRMSISRASAPKRSAIFAVCHRVSLMVRTLRVVKSYRAAIGNGNNDLFATSLRLEEIRDHRMVTRLAQTASQFKNLLAQLSTWYTSRDTDVSRLSEVCFQTLRSVAVNASTLAQMILEFAENVKVAQATRQARDYENVSLVGFTNTRFANRLTSCGVEDEGTRKALQNAVGGARRAVPRLILQADGLSSAAKQLGIDIGIRGRLHDDNNKEIPGLEPEAFGTSLGRWQERCRTSTGFLKGTNDDPDVTNGENDDEKSKLNEAAMDVGGEAETDEESISKCTNTRTPSKCGIEHNPFVEEEAKHTMEHSCPTTGFGVDTIVVSFRRKSKT